MWWRQINARKVYWHVSASACFFINTFPPSVTLHIETNHFFCSAKQIIAFYMKCNTERKWDKKDPKQVKMKADLECSLHFKSRWEAKYWRKVQRTIKCKFKNYLRLFSSFSFGKLPSSTQERHQGCQTKLLLGSNLQSKSYFAWFYYRKTNTRTPTS